MCEKDALAIFLIEQKTWPYHDMPFTGYWDNYDNKLVSIVAEPYLRLALTIAWSTWSGSGLLFMSGKDMVGNRQ